MTTRITIRLNTWDDEKPAIRRFLALIRSLATLAGWSAVIRITSQEK